MFRRLSPGLMELIPHGYNTMALRMTLVSSDRSVKYYQYAYRRLHHHLHIQFYYRRLLHLLRCRKYFVLSLCLHYEFHRHHSHVADHAGLLHLPATQDNQYKALDIFIQVIINTTRGVHPLRVDPNTPASELEPSRVSQRRWRRSTPAGHSPRSLPKDRLVLHGPELCDASITAMHSCTVAGSAFLLVRDASRGTFTADAHVINGSSMRTVNFLSEKNVRVAR